MKRLVVLLIVLSLFTSPVMTQEGSKIDPSDDDTDTIYIAETDYNSYHTISRNFVNGSYMYVDWVTEFNQRQYIVESGDSRVYSLGNHAGSADLSLNVLNESNGTVTNQDRVSGYVGGLSVTEDHVVVATTSPSGAPDDFYIYLFDRQGNLVSFKSFQGIYGDSVHNIVTEDNTIYMRSYSSSVARFDIVGDEVKRQWTTEVDLSSDNHMDLGTTHLYTMDSSERIIGIDKVTGEQTMTTSESYSTFTTNTMNVYAANTSGGVTKMTLSLNKTKSDSDLLYVDGDNYRGVSSTNTGGLFGDTDVMFGNNSTPQVIEGGKARMYTLSYLQPSDMIQSWSRDLEVVENRDPPHGAITSIDLRENRPTIGILYNEKELYTNTLVGTENGVVNSAT